MSSPADTYVGFAATADGGAAPSQSNGANEPWQPLPGTPPAFPLDALPADMRQWVEAIAEETQTPEDLAALDGLGVLAAAAQGRAVVDCGRWREELALWLIVALPTGDHKSTVRDEAIAPLRTIERELQEATAPLRRERARRRAILEGQQEKLTKAAIKEDDGDARKQIEGELVPVAEELDELPLLPKPRLLADDVTPEGIARRLAEHGKLVITSAESAAVDNLLGKYDGKSDANLHVVCQAYSGEATQIDRAKGDPKELERPLLTIILTPQPHVLQKITAHELARAQGFLARCSLVLPRSRMGSRSVDAKAAPAHLRGAWAALVRHTYGPPNPATEPTEPPSDPSNVATRPHSVGSVADSLKVKFKTSLSLSSDAAAAFRAFRKEMEPRLAPDADLRPFIEYVTKHEGRVARIAGLLHLAENPPGEPISAETMGNALRIGEYLLAHTLFAVKIADDTVRRALAWLAVREEPFVSKRDLHHGLLSHAPAPEADALLEKLVALGAVRLLEAPPPSGPGQPPSPTYEINPSLFVDVPRGPQKGSLAAVIAAGEPKPEFGYERPSADDEHVAFASNSNGSSR